MELHTETMQASIIPTYKAKTIAPQQPAMDVSADIKTAAPEYLKTDQVSISEEAHKKSKDDINQSAMRDILGTEGAENKNKEESTLDEKIAELKEDIAKLTAEVVQARVNGDEEKTKRMEVELAMLNSQLLQLIEQKLA